MTISNFIIKHFEDTYHTNNFILPYKEANLYEFEYEGVTILDEIINYIVDNHKSEVIDFFINRISVDGREGFFGRIYNIVFNDSSLIKVILKSHHIHQRGGFYTTFNIVLSDKEDISDIINELCRKKGNKNTYGVFEKKYPIELIRRDEKFHKDNWLRICEDTKKCIEYEATATNDDRDKGYAKIGVTPVPKILYDYDERHNQPFISHILTSDAKWYITKFPDSEVTKILLEYDPLIMTSTELFITREHRTYYKVENIIDKIIGFFGFC